MHNTQTTSRFRSRNQTALLLSWLRPPSPPTRRLVCEQLLWILAGTERYNRGRIQQKYGLRAKLKPRSHHVN